MFIRVGKNRIFGALEESQCTLASPPFAKTILRLGNHFSKRTACHNTLGLCSK